MTTCRALVYVGCYANRPAHVCGEPALLRAVNGHPVCWVHAQAINNPCRTERVTFEDQPRPEVVRFLSGRLKKELENG